MEIGEILTLWTVFSFIVVFLWCLMMGDAGTSNTSDIIVTVICFILGFPVFFIGTILILTTTLIFERNFKRNGN